ncbi:MAG: DNA gyrase C-terminal beta-propeller domain-containing protein [Caldilineaceae bacterium]
MEPSEPPTTINIISISQDGLAKRTPRHLYFRQRRGGMGVFDIETPDDDPPAFLAAADKSAGLVIITSQARAFRLAVRNLPETPVRGRGESVFEGFTLRPGEKLALAFADTGGSHLALISERGQVRRIAAHYFGQNLQPGTVLYDVKEGGPPAAACWTPGDGDLFLATQNGQAIRFSERQVPVRGCLGMRVERDDAIIGAAAVYEESGVFLVTDEGKGTIRLMGGFGANKAPGSGGKTAIKADRLVGVAAAAAGDDVFLISRLGKMIRFQADEVPAKEGVVQGVNCINLRADSCVAAVVSRI